MLCAPRLFVITVEDRNAPGLCLVWIMLRYNFRRGLGILWYYRVTCYAMDNVCLGLVLLYTNNVVYLLL